MPIPLSSTRSSRPAAFSIILTALLWLLPAAVFAQQATDRTSLVNVFIGAGPSVVNDNGLTNPSATLPFGMLSWGPDPVKDPFYHYYLSQTRGFSLTHLSGVGCPAFGDIPIMPIQGVIGESPAQQPPQYTDGYQHSSELAEPGYYSVSLRSGTKVELAASSRSGLGVVTFDSPSKKHTLLVDLSRSMNRSGVIDADIHIAGNRITGSSAGGSFCSKGNRYRIYFSIESQEQPESSCTFNDREVLHGATDAKGWNVGGCLVFSESQQKIHLKVAVSYVSVAGAIANAGHEIPAWDIDAVRRKGHDAWNQYLGAIEVNGGTRDRRSVFYTALYHSLLTPTVFNDWDGKYIGFDDAIHNTNGHTHFANYSGWDIYRSQVQLVAMLFPSIGSDIAQSLVDDGEQAGGLPIWPLANDETGEMVGDPSDPVIASIHAFGGKNFSTAKALQLMVRGAENPRTHVRWQLQRPGLAEYLKKGYISESAATAGSASVTLEYTTADFSIAAFAAALGEKDIAARFLRKSDNWRNLFDPQSKYIRPRNEKGEFLENFDPASGKGFVEGNSAQYTWMIPYNMNGVIDALGGKEETRARLDRYFSQYGKWNGGPFFLLSNEPSFGNPWIYNWTGQPWRTQEVVRRTVNDLFTADPGGIPGNDDLGATSSWLVFAELGMFPAIPGVGGVTLSTPAFPDVMAHLGNHVLHIQAPGSQTLPYISDIVLDGKKIGNWWIPWESLSTGNKLVFSLQDRPNQLSGSAPPSYVP